jgi:hypothetical protein
VSSISSEESIFPKRLKSQKKEREKEVGGRRKFKRIGAAGSRTLDFIDAFLLRDHANEALYH